MQDRQMADAVAIAAYSFQNSNANLRRVEQRIRDLERAAETLSTVEQEGDGYTCREDVDENRVMFLFDGKPDETTRTLLKQHGFKWSPSRAAWVRMLNNAGRFAAKCVKQALANAK